MPYKIRQRGGRYEVYNSDTGRIHARHTTKRKAQAQIRLLRGVEHGMRPRGRR